VLPAYPGWEQEQAKFSQYPTCVQAPGATHVQLHVPQGAAVVVGGLPVVVLVLVVDVELVELVVLVVKGTQLE